MESLIIGIIILIASTFLNRMLNVKEAKGDVFRPSNGQKNNDYKGEIEVWSSSDNRSNVGQKNQNPPRYPGLMELESKIVEGGNNNPYLESSVDNYAFENGILSNGNNEIKIAKQQEPYDRRTNLKQNDKFNFDLSNAIIYSALLNPKFKEFK